MKAPALRRAWHSLYTRLALGLVAVLILVGLLYGGFAWLLLEQLQRTASQEINRNLAAHLVADNRIVQDGQLNETALKKTFMDYMSINPSIEIYTLDLNGKILSYSAEPGVVQREYVSLKPIHDFLAGSPMFPLLGDDPRSEHRQKAFSVTPLPSAEAPQGYLYVVLQGEKYAAAQSAQARHYLLWWISLGLAGSLLIGLVVGLFIFRRLTRRLKALQANVSAFAEGGFRHPETLQASQPPGDEAADELTELETRFAQMSQRIAEQWDALSQQDRLRRELIASISHDLRTPLAAAQGYLETLELKADSLDDAQRRDYLRIALRQTHRLQALISQLFELAKLEADDTRLHFEHFSILELAYDVVEKFRLKAEAAGVRLSISPEAEDARVTADIALIERVLDNLLDNALQHTPAGKNIWIDIRSEGEQRISVSVNDEGKGIDHSEKELIFKRFHRSNNPERDQTAHAGLGLSIVKKIIELHQQSIRVDSREASGSRFTFTLSVDA